MYYTHGDTVIVRSSPSPPVRPPAREGRGAEAARSQRSVADDLYDRVTQLEAKLAKLETELQSARQMAIRHAPGPVGSLMPAAPPMQAGGDVKVSLHAGSGAHATVGQVKVDHT